jgi:anti-sigma factor RsiW
VNCSDFQANLHLYLDGELEGAKFSGASSHVAACGACDHIVTDHQKARALLITAVADRAAAVDVSGVWGEIVRRLDEPQPNVTLLEGFRARRALRPRLRQPAMVQMAAFATAAAAAVLVLTFAPFRNVPAQRSPASVAPLATQTGATVRPQPVSIGTGAIAQSRPVRIDSMEIGAGHTVSTWIKPRTKTRVIWVASLDSAGYGVSNVSQTR